jgi:hypothetical protein
VRKAFLGADREHDLALGVEVHAETAAVQLGHGQPEVGEAARRRVAVVARVASGLG